MIMLLKLQASGNFYRMEVVRDVSDEEYLRGDDVSEVRRYNSTVINPALVQILQEFVDEEGFFLFNVNPFGGIITSRDGLQRFYGMETVMHLHRKAMQEETCEDLWDLETVIIDV